MLKLTDLRKTTRRAGKDGDLRVVYPRFLRDRSLAPRIELATRYLEKMVGHTRRELDQEVVTQLFGDHKLARCVVACLATSYRYRVRSFGEVVAPEIVARFIAQGITAPLELRLWLYRRANRTLPGFVGGEERAPFLRSAGEELGVAPKEIETLIGLDDPAQAMLVRVGPIPSAEDARARFNYEVAAALLASAATVRVSLAGKVHNSTALRDLAERLDVPITLTSRELTLAGRQDALNGWARHGARLVRLLSTLLVAGLPARKAEALIDAPNGQRWLFRLDTEILSYLGASAATELNGASSLDLRALTDGLGRTDTLLAEFAALRRAGAAENWADGWALRRASEPLVFAEGIAPVLFQGVRGDQRVMLALAPTSDMGVQQYHAVARRVPLIHLRLANGAPELWDAAVDMDETGATPTLTYRARGDLAVLPALLNQVVARASHLSDTARLEALFDEASETGVLTEGALAERLRCGEDEVAERLAVPTLEAARQARQLQYVEGFGLCTRAVLTRARAAADDVAILRERTDGPARVVRALGRRLREVTGASEGIECLIAYLGAA
jgi:predicted nuclease of restriction endonuclease-like RecB superfamily